MSVSDTISPSAKALLPFALFLTLFIGVGGYLTWQGVDFAFYQLPAPVAILPAIVLAILLSKEKLNKAIEQFIRGMGHSDIIAMCLIYLLAGAFAAVAKATGGVEATVNLGLSLLPVDFILPGLFVISAFVATAMGTSMGTIGAIAPVAVGLAQATGLSLPLTAGVVLSGAMFGDNLSIISDTTIAATRSQGCQMRDKFRENLRLALPAAIGALLIFAFMGESSVQPEIGPLNIALILPYVTILVLAVSGVNVFVVLSVGILLAGGVGFLHANYDLSQYGKDIYAGFSNMQEIFLLSLLIGGLSELMRLQGGLAFVVSFLRRALTRFSGRTKGELGVASLAALTNVCVANNTVAIIVAGSVAKEWSKECDVPAKRSASLLDIFSCVVQGVLPYGAQALLLGSIFGLSPLNVVAYSYYCFLLALSALVAILWSKRITPVESIHHTN